MHVRPTLSLLLSLETVPTLRRKRCQEEEEETQFTVSQTCYLQVQLDNRLLDTPEGRQKKNEKINDDFLKKETPAKPFPSNVTLYKGFPSNTGSQRVIHTQKLVRANVFGIQLDDRKKPAMEDPSNVQQYNQICHCHP